MPAVMRTRKSTIAGAGISLAALAGCPLFEESSEDAPDADPAGAGDATSGGDDAAPPLDEVPSRVRDTIRADDYTRLVLEVDVVEDKAPRDGVEDELEELFADILNKPDGIEAVRDDVLDPRGSDHEWSFEELRELADETFDLDVDEDTTALHALWVDGRSERDDDDSRILGLQFGRHTVLFKDTIEDVCESSSTPVNREQACRRTERAIWIHEIGHAIGLVDNGLPMVEDHKDEGRGAHSENDECIMYWAYTGEALGDRVVDAILGGEPELGFDEYCLHDIEALREGS